MTLLLLFTQQYYFLFFKGVRNRWKTLVVFDGALELGTLAHNVLAYSKTRGSGKIIAFHVLQL